MPVRLSGFPSCERFIPLSLFAPGGFLCLCSQGPFVCSRAAASARGTALGFVYLGAPFMGQRLNFNAGELTLLSYHCCFLTSYL